MNPKTETKKADPQAILDHGMALYEDFLEYVSFIHEPNAHKLARTPRTNTLESFVSAKDQRTQYWLMLAEYMSNQKTPTPQPTRLK
jgi:hypothetical protein